MTDNIVTSNTGASVVPTSPSGGVASPKTVKKMEKEIMQEAKHEEKELKNATKDMDRTKKAERKAQKTMEKAERMLEKMVEKEKDALAGVHKAEHKHEIAVADLNKAKKDLQTSVEQHEQLKEALGTKSSRVEYAVNAKEENTVSFCSLFNQNADLTVLVLQQGRNSKLDSLRGSSILSNPALARTSVPQN
ncbi:hypothetical protein CVT25_010883 [Psilocybe cyanescens]|uniref:Uncharacterized protein n=1 Tax=Psilocybe cyanescens TaxID=93625 RepID=A0A409WFP9_PSICY|nr:hypothetical protein CVT25_010883 [Psilocybe cyanescens]